MSFIAIVTSTKGSQVTVSCSADNVAYFGPWAGKLASQQSNFVVVADFRTLHDQLVQDGFELKNVTSGANEGHMTHFFWRATRTPLSVAAASTTYLPTPK